MLFTEQQIRKRVRELAAQLNRELGHQPVLVVSVLENAFVFTADLIRALKVPVYCCFVRADIRDSAVGGVETREISYTPSVDASGKDVVLIEGILQSGMTFDHLYRYLTGQRPSSLRTMVLVEKTDERKVDLPLDFVGFKASGKFVVGYGLGQDGKYKNLSYIAQLS
ncbi:MAG: hypoxanthine phosphoribosyltransferase [Acidobacteria bacterium]|nr:hypoxanthine phosphoribosyltransferase [Acidobacteriota bacterium]